MGTKTSIPSNKCKFCTLNNWIGAWGFSPRCPPQIVTALVVFFGKDINLIVLVIVLTQRKVQIYFMKPGRGNMETKVIYTSELQLGYFLTANAYCSSKFFLVWNMSAIFDWVRDDLISVKTTELPAPTNVLNGIFCRCSRGCGNRCGCRKAGIHCTLACGYEWACLNHPTLEVL